MELIIGIILALIFIFIIWLFAIAPQIKNRPDMTELRKFDYAHRGLHNNKMGIPENSLKSFRLAAEKGFGMELDLQITKDKKIVVHHDLSLKRLCGEDVNICDLTLEEVKKYRLLDTNESIPTFKETLNAVGMRVPLIIEIKHYTDPDEISQLCYEALTGYKGLYCIESFDPRIVRWYKNNAPHIIRGQLMESLKENKEIGKVYAFFARNLCSNFLTRPNFEAYDYHTRNRPSMWLAKKAFALPEVSWTIKDWKVYRELKKDGCIVIFEGFEPNARYQPVKKKRAENTVTVATITPLQGKE